MKNIPALLLMAIAAFHSTAQVSLERISVVKNQFILAGKPVVFRGLNTSDPDKLQRQGHWDDAYFKEIRSWGANIVRFPVHPSAWRNRGHTEYLKLLDLGVKLAADHHMYVIIDWHSIGNLEDEKFTAPMYNTTKEETLSFWKLVAAHYKDNSTVAFLELFNEPTTKGGELGECSWQQWRVLMEENINAIRATGSKAIPLVAGFNWGYFLTDVTKDPVNAEGIGYVSHPYPQKRNKPWEDQWTADWGHVSEKYPMMLTEIGFCGPDDRGAHIPVLSDESYGDAITQYTAERGISYVVWVFDPQWSPMLIEDWNFTPTRQGRYFKKALTLAK